MQIEAVSININHRYIAGGWLAVRRATKRPKVKVVAIQEGRWLAKLPTWIVALGFIRFAVWPAVPILVHKSLRVKGIGSWHLTDQSPVSPAAAGPTMADEKRANYVVVEDPDEPDQLVAYINGHLTPSKWDPRAAALWKRQVLELARLVAMFHDAGIMVVLMMDGNAKWLDPDFEPLRRELYKISGPEPTMHGKAIDTIAASRPNTIEAGHPGITSGAHGVMAGSTAKEHKLVWAEVNTPRHAA